jgi:apolipoprotein N-acyltransferase
MARPDGIEFKSKIDLWLLVVLLLLVAACIAPIAQNWEPFVGELWWATLLLAPGILLPLWLLVGTRYFLGDNQLVVRCGPFRWDVAIADISSIEPTSGVLSAPALSLQRLRIAYGDGKEIVISPEPRKEFVRQLEYRINHSVER